MSFTKLLKWAFAGCMIISTLSCTEKLETGSVLKDFTGIAGAEALSPTAIRVYWDLHDRYKNYKVFNSTSTTAVAETSRSEVIVRSLNPGTSYTFKVVATDGELSVGGNKEVTVSTLTPFSGVDKVIKDSDGNLILSWVYVPKVSEYQIFYKKYEDPTATNTSNWKSVDRTSVDTKYTFRGLEGSTRYHFVVQVKYLDETYEYPTKSVNIFTNSTFPTPAYSLSPISIGSLPFVTVTPVVNSTYKNENYVSRMYSGTTAISDPLVGAGTITFSPTSGVTNGKLENLSLQVSYTDSGTTETLIFDKLSTYIKGILGLKESPPIKSLDSGIAFMGESMTTGDFNCDGYPDLAIGLPSVSVSTLGVNQPKAGAVYVYYSVKNTSTGVYSLNTSGTPSRNPTTPGVDPQVLTFDDLNSYARFGKSLSGNGNLNGDTLLGKACQDLIVGSPGYNTPNTSGADRTYDGAAFVFFGSGKGLTAPSRIKDMQQNVETCNGLVENATCSAVMLWPNMALLPSAYITTSAMVANDDPQFGFSVSYIGDFNADGYDDIAVGAPTAPWDGLADPTSTGVARFVIKAGYVGLFFGSKNGLGYETPLATSVPTTSDTKFRFLKIFSPIPHENQMFGYSVGGGADVDGRYRIRDANDKLVGGSDMIIGAPGDRYPNATTLTKLKITGTTCNPGSDTTVAAATCKSFGFGTGGWGGFTSDTAGTSHYYGLPTNAGTATNVGDVVGAAYLYFGRGATSAPASGVKESPSRQSFWNCGARGMTAGSHYSCLVSPSSVRVLFPRSNYKTSGGYALKNLGFGTSVALVGDPSHYDSNNAAITSPTDTNGDGYAEAVVGTGYFSNYSTSNTGALWTFYGNPYRHYEYSAFYQIDATTPTNKDLDWSDSIAQCTAFTTNNNDTKELCSPTLIRSNSIGSGFYLGLDPEAIAVGDVTGDGLKDVVVGARGDTTKGTASGGVYAFTSLSGSGLTTNFLKFYNTNAQTYDYFGRSVAVGNFDGDFKGTTPLNDVAVGAYLDKTTKNGGGGVYGFNSNGQPLSSVNSVPSFSIYDTLGSPQSLGYESIRIVGDINRDGYADAVAKISRPSTTGTAYTTDAVVFYGSKLGLISTSFCKENQSKIFKSGSGSEDYCYPSTAPAQGVTLDDIALPQLISKPTNITSAWALRAFDVGDINGDGFADVAFVDPTTSGAGQIVVYYGSRGGLQAVNNPQWNPAYGDPQIVTKRWAYQNNPSTVSDTNTTIYRRQLITYGDFNGDGLSDIVISNPYGSAFNLMNKTTTRGTFNPGNPPETSAGIPAAGAGWQCTSASSDSGCTGGAAAYEMGRVWIYYGSTAGVQTPKVKGYSATDLEPDVYDNLASASPTYMVDVYNSEDASSTTKACTGTTTKNCKMQYLYDPFIENINHGYDRMLHHFGQSVAVVDVDHDGIDDLVVSAPGWEDVACYYDTATTTQNVRNDYGRIFIYHGSANGIIAAAPRDYYSNIYTSGSCLSDDLFQRNNSESLNIDGTGKLRSLMPPIMNGGYGSNGDSRNFGYTIASAGDVNNDGYEDLIVTAPNEAAKSTLAGAGVGYIYYGPLCGNDNNTDMWLSAIAGNMNTQYQFSDNAIGAPAMAECAKASGLSKPAPQAFYVWDAASGEKNGATVITGRTKKGDFNGDGYDDVILGAPYWTDQVNSNTNYGRGIVFFGSSTGLHTADYPDSSVVADSVGHVKPYIIQNTDNAPSPRYFWANPSSGDINGDGTMDIMVPTEMHDGYSPIVGVKIGTYFLLF